jgi:regulator of protease activity HflC (stomatin/prohibitin superfamily)
MSSFPSGPAAPSRASWIVRAIIIAAAVLVAAPLVLGNMFNLFSNPATPAGYVGYVSRGALVGRNEFYGLQTGPTSTGLGWMLNVINVSVTPFTSSEEFVGDSTVLSADSLKIAFRVHVVWRVKPDGVREFIERFSTLRANDNPDRIVQVAYNNFLREPLRTYARDEVQRFRGLEIKDNITPIGAAISRRVNELTAGTPFEVRSVVVGNIQYPTEVSDAVSKKLAAVQELERKGTEIEIAVREKEKRIIEAEGVARATEIISQRLTGAYLQYEAIKAQQEMAASKNQTTIYIPVGPMGVPIVGNLNLTPPAAPAPEAK